MNHPFKGLTRTLARPVVLFSTIAALVLSPGGLGLMSSGWAQEINNEGAEVLTRGPVHEAFAGTIIYKATPGLVVPKAPPAEVEEIPPDQRPEGANVTWIPGYWAWDDEAGEFLWVSGIWRNLPPGRQWIPGYWWESGQDYQWISGYWADAAAEEVEYLDEPPASLEAGPNISAPTRSHSWIPGTWRWSESRYIWQPGYWYLARPDWVWVPSYYTRAPLGYIYVDGYYDYDVPRRGMVFAPVRFSGSYYSRPDYYYRPTTVISITALLDHLFLRPRRLIIISATTTLLSTAGPVITLPTATIPGATGMILFMRISAGRTGMTTVGSAVLRTTFLITATTRKPVRRAPSPP